MPYSRMGCLRPEGRFTVPREVDRGGGRQGDEWPRQDTVVMPDDLLGREHLAVPRAVGVADQDRLEAEAEGAAAARVDADLALRAGDDQPADPRIVERRQQSGLVEPIGGTLVDHRVARSRCD